MVYIIDSTMKGLLSFLYLVLILDTAELLYQTTPIYHLMVILSIWTPLFLLSSEEVP